MYNEGLKNAEKDILCLMCFSFTYVKINLCYNSLKDKDFIVNLNDNSYEKQPSIHCGKYQYGLTTNKPIGQYTFYLQEVLVRIVIDFTKKFIYIVFQLLNELIPLLINCIMYFSV